MKNKKAWLRIVEAVISILIISSVLVIMVLRNSEETDIGREIHDVQRIILKQVSLNNTLREEILQGDKTNTEIFINGMVPSSWQFAIKICETGELCDLGLEVDAEIYADQILISSTLQQYAPKKLKFFVWIEK